MKQTTRRAYILYAFFMLDLIFDPYDGDSIFLRSVSGLSAYYTALYSRR
jgi:hypothetical protein